MRISLLVIYKFVIFVYYSCYLCLQRIIVNYCEMSIIDNKQSVNNKTNNFVGFTMYLLKTFLSFRSVARAVFREVQTFFFNKYMVKPTKLFALLLIHVSPCKALKEILNSLFDQVYIQLNFKHNAACIPFKP